MRSIYRFLLIFAMTAAVLSACGEKEEPNQGQGQGQVSQKPSEEIRQADQFATDLYSVYYLWNKEIGNDIKRLDPDTCKSPVAVVQQIRFHKAGKEVDHWTQLTNNLGEMTSSVQGLGLTYGYELQAGRIANKDGVYFLLVCYVVKDGPAEKGGLKRGDIIMTIDGEEITSSNIYDALYTKTVSLGIAHLTGEGYLGAVEKEVTLAAADMWEDPVLLHKTFDVDGKKVGYLVYNSFDVKSMETLPDIFRQFGEDGIQELILDLRYNGGGYVATELELASMIAPPANVAAGDIFQTEVYNSILAEAWKDEDFNTYFRTTHTYKDDSNDISVDVSDANPGVGKLYAIVSSGSASASEGLIIGLGPYMSVTLVGQQTGQHRRDGLRMAVHRTVNHHHLLVLRLVAAPLVVFLDELAEILAPDGAVERADHGNVERGGLLEEVLDLDTVLSYNISIIAAGFVHPFAVEVDLIGVEVAAEGAECSEGVGGEKHLVGGVVGDQHLGPVDHLRPHEVEGMLAGTQDIPFLDNLELDLFRNLQELLHEAGGLQAAHDDRIRPAHQHVEQGCQMVGFHVVNDDVVQRTPGQHRVQILQELCAHRLIDRVQKHRLFIGEDVGVVGCAARDRHHVLKKSQSSVGRADVP